MPSNAVAFVGRLPMAISAIIAAIDEGVEQARAVVDYAAPPRSIDFTGDAAVSFNSLQRESETTVSRKSTTTVGEVLARDDFYLNGLLVESVEYVDSSGYVVEEQFIGGGSKKVAFEDNAVRFQTRIFGPSE